MIASQPATVTKLLKQLQSQQVQLNLKQGKLSIKAPPGVLTNTLKEQLQLHKSALIDLLATMNESAANTVAINPVSRDGELPLSFAQQRQWLLQQLDPESHAYTISAALRLCGPLNHSALQKALDTLFYRHEILRTTYRYLGSRCLDDCAVDEHSVNDRCVNNKPVDDNDVTHTSADDQLIQHIKTPTPAELTFYTLPKSAVLDATDDKAILQHAKPWLVKQAQQPFDLAHDNALRVQLVQLNHQDHILQWVMHHIAVDEWSISLLIREFAVLYHTACEDKHLSVLALANTLPAEAIQYADFAVWQRNNLQGKKLKQQLAYWREALGDHQPVLTLPTDYPRPAVQTYNGERYTFSLDKSLSLQIQRLTEKERITPFLLLLGCYQKLLQQYSGQDDIRVGVPNANRNRFDVHNLVGFFVNTLVLPARFNDALTVNGFFEQIKERHLSAQEHQDIPFEMLVDELVANREVSHSPLFQVMFNFLQADNESQLALDGLSITPLDLQQGEQAKFDLTLTIESRHQQSLTAIHHPLYTCTLEYNTDLFARSRMEHFARHYKHLLEQLVHALLDSPQQQIQTISALETSDIDQQLYSWNATELSVDFKQDLIARFEQQAAKTPEAIAAFYSAEKSPPEKEQTASEPARQTVEHIVSYRVLNEKANQLAHYLYEQGIEANDLVAVCLERRENLLIALLAIQKSGGAYLPIDPQYPLARRRYILKHAKPVMLLTEPSLQSSLSDMLECEKSSVDERKEKKERGKTNRGDHSNSALLSLPWLSLGHSTWLTSQGQSLSPSEWPNNNLSLPLQDNQLAYTLYTSGSTGNPKGVQISRKAFVNFLCAMQQEIQLQPQDRWLAVTTISFDIAGLELFLPIITGAATIIASSEQASNPSALHRLLAEQSVSIMQATPATWQMLMDDAEPIEPLAWNRLKVLCGGEALSAQLANRLLAQKVNLLNVYGPTETTVWSTCHAITEPLQTPALIGQPIANTQCYVLDRLMQPVPVGSLGELYIGGDGLAEGYLHRDDLTAKAFVPNPFTQTPGEYLYRTGDKVRYNSDGCIEYQGRVDFQVKIRGFRIELGDIEQHLCDSSQVDKAIVTAVERHVDNDKQLVAYIVSAQGDIDINRDALRTELLTKLPQYMVPSLFVQLDVLPLTDNGKVNRKALPKPDLSEAQQRYIAPNTKHEKALCDIWQQVLHVEQVGLDDNFFLLGGHSLLATRVVAQVNKHFGIQLPLKAVFLAQTPRELIKVVTSEEAVTQQSIKLQPMPKGATAALSFAQQRLWMLDQLEAGSSHYHLPVKLRLVGDLNIEALAYAFNSIIKRHESLRTCFRQEHGQPLQVVKAVAPLNINPVDLSSLATDAKAQKLKQLTDEFALAPFDLSRDLMLRVQLFKLTKQVNLAKQEYILLVVMHHIAADGWSMAIVVREFKAYYQAYIEKNQPCLPTLPIQYADYAHWQRHWLQGERQQKSLAYWQSQLAELPITHSLPLDFPRPIVQSFEGALHCSALDVALTNRLQSFCQTQGSTLFMGLHAAMSVLLSRYSNEQDIVMGTPIANREQAEVADLIGFFVNTLVLRSNLSGSPSFKDVLHQSCQTLLDAYQHQQLPFEQLVDQLQPERSTSHSPLFQVMLSLQNNESTELCLPSLTLSLEPPSIEMAKFDLTIDVVETSRGLSLRWIYNQALFKASTIAQWARHFETLLQNLLLEPKQPVNQVHLLSPREFSQQLRIWNDTQADYPRGICVHERFEAQVKQTPDATALVYADESINYKQLNNRANQLAHYLLQDRCINPDDRVGIYHNRSIEVVVCILATLKAGAAYMPLDPSHPQARIAYMCDDADLRLILTTETLGNALANELSQTSDCEDKEASFPSEQRICLDNTQIKEALDNHSTANIPAQSIGLSENHLAYVIYTSGSTGKPKGVMVERRGIRNLMHWYQKEYALTSADRCLVASAIGFDLTQKNLLAPLISGATVVLQTAGVYDPDAIRRTISQQSISLINCAPSAFYSIVECSAINEYADLQSLRLVLLGGEPINSRVLSPWLAHTHCQAALINMYGPTECTDIVTACAFYQDESYQDESYQDESYQDESIDASGLDANSIDISRIKVNSIGNAIANVETFVLNEALIPQPIGVIGELYVGGAGVARGYLNDPELTHAKFITNPFITSALTTPAATSLSSTASPLKTSTALKTAPSKTALQHKNVSRLYKTGDRVRRLANGELEFVGRVDHQVKYRGFRVALGEIVQCLEQLTEVNEALVSIAGEGPNAKIIAHITVPSACAVDDSAIFSQRLRQALEQQLPGYMVPSAFVALEAFPLTPNGKVDRKALPAPDLSLTQQAYVSPRNDVEEQLCAIWQDVLGLDQVGITDNFFELGGHSLLVIQVLARAQEQGLSFTAHQLFSSPQIHDLASIMAEGCAFEAFNVPANMIASDCQHLTPDMLPLVKLSAEELQSIVDAVPGGTTNIQDIYPLAPLQEGIFFHHMMSQESDPYVLPNMLVVEHKVALDNLIAALEFVVARHDVLRTAILWEGLSVPVQVVCRQASIDVQWLDVSESQDAESHIRALCMPELQRLDITKAPMLRLQVAKDHASTQHFVLLQFHHLISDHEGLEILQRELMAFQQARADLLPVTVPYRQFVAQALHQNAQLDIEDFFGNMLGDIEEPCLPFNLQDTQGNGSQIIELREAVPSNIAQQIRRIAQRLCVTPASIFHLAWGMVVAACTSQQDVVFGTVMSGRLQGIHKYPQGAENTLGVFMNTLPIRLKLSHSEHVSPQQDSVRQQLLSTHQQLCELLPYEQCSLAHASRCSAVAAELPLFSALLNYRHSGSSTSNQPNHNKQSASFAMLEWHERTNYPFNLAVDDFGKQGFGLDVQIDSSVDAQAILAYTQQALAQLANSLLQQPERALGTLCVVPKQALQQYNDWNDTDADYSAAGSVEQRFEHQVRRVGSKTAVRHGEQSLSYESLNTQANQLAHYLLQQGIGPEQRVLICQHRSLSMLVSLLAVLKAGATYVPVDPSYPKERVLYMLEDAAVSLTLTDHSVLASDLLAHLSSQANQQKPLVVNVDDTALFRQFSSENPTPLANTEQLAYMIYTSGSTGKPKAVQISRGNMLNFLCGMDDLLQPAESDCLLAVTSLSFDIAVLELFLPLICGAEVVIGGGTLAQDGQALKAAIEHYGVTMMQATPISWKMLLANHWEQTTPFKVLCGGEPFPGDLAELLLKHTPLDVWNLYGPTETTVWSSAYQLTREKAEPYSAVPIGQPIANTQLYVLNTHFKPVPTGVAGELCIGGRGVARGYFNRANLTQSRFVDTDYGRVYRTGDLARYNTSGTLECLGRLDHQVKIRGFRIELGEIEFSLATHPQVQEGVVHPHHYHDESILVGYVVLVDQKAEVQQADISVELQSHLRQTLPNYMVPASIVVLPNLPLTPNGKVDRKALPDPSFNQPQQGYIAPRNELETKLQEIWQDLLGMTPIGVEDNFFRLGGHSLLATRLMMRCQEAFQIKLKLVDLFHRQTIADMALFIERARDVQAETHQKMTIDETSLSRIDDLLAEFED